MPRRSRFANWRGIETGTVVPIRKPESPPPESPPPRAPDPVPRPEPPAPPLPSPPPIPSPSIPVESTVPAGHTEPYPVGTLPLTGTPPTPTRRGYTQVPNAVLDDVLPTLTAPEQLVYLRLYRLSYGFGRASCSVGYAKLAKTTNLGRNTVIRAVGQLEAKGLVVRQAEGAGAATSVYHVARPGVPDAGIPTTGVPVKGRSKEISKEREKTERTPDEQRKLAQAFIREQRRQRPGITDAELWPVAVEWAAGQGVEARWIAEAIG
jgi:hypothetical protein